MCTVKLLSIARLSDVAAGTLDSLLLHAVVSLHVADKSAVSLHAPDC